MSKIALARILILRILITCLLFSALIGCRNNLKVQGFEDKSLDIKVDEVDADIADLITPYRLELATEMDVILCENNNDMTKARPESALGNFFSDACLTIAREDYDGTIDAAMFNTGGIRSSLSAGPVAVGDIYSIMPFDNELVVVELPYSQLIKMSEYIATTGGEPIADMRIALNGSQVSSFLIGDKTVTERNYFILTSDYLAKGGDRMDFFTEEHRVSIHVLGIKIRDALMNRCAQLQSEGKSIDYRTDGRITKE